MDSVVKIRLCVIKFTTWLVVNLEVGGKFINFANK